MAIRKKRKQPPKRPTTTPNPEATTTPPRKRGRPRKKTPEAPPPEETPVRPRSQEKTVSCTICLDTSRCRKMRVLPCSHGFHERCVNRWLEMDIKCPLCRTWFLDLSKF